MRIPVTAQPARLTQPIDGSAAAGTIRDLARRNRKVVCDGSENQTGQDGDGTIMTNDGLRYRLITRSVYDELVCTVPLRTHQMLDDIMFVHPKDMRNGLVKITSWDIITNLPYVDVRHLCFDHHGSEEMRNVNILRQNKILDPSADSVARFHYNYFGGATQISSLDSDIM